MYTTGDILLKVPEISRDILYNWMNRGYLIPIQIPIGDKGYHRREFSEADYLKIWLMWKFYREQGMPPRLASLKADELFAKASVLRLSVEKTFQEKTALSNMLRLSLTERFDVIATIEAYQVERCNVSVSFKSQYLSLETGVPNQRLQFDVYDTVDVHWTFRADQTTGEQPIPMHIAVRSGDAMRAVLLPVEVRA